MQWEQRRRRTGLCSFTSYYVGRPTTRVVDETYSETVYELQPDQIKARRRRPRVCRLLQMMPRLLLLLSPRIAGPLHVAAGTRW